MTSPRRGALARYGFAFALLSALFVFQPLATAAYLKLFYEKSEELIQPRIDPQLPVPARLIWSDNTWSLINNLGPMSLGFMLLWHIFLALWFGYGVLRILNPTFRITTGVDWDRGLLIRTYMHTSPLTKAFLIAIAAFLPAFAFWHAVAWALGNNTFTLVLRSTILGGAFWLLFSQSGIAGNYESGNYELPLTRAERKSLLIRGMIAGAYVSILLLVMPAGMVDTLFGFHRSLGGLGEQAFWKIAVVRCGIAAIIGFSAAAAAIALGSPTLNPSMRVRNMIVSFAALSAALMLWNVWIPGYWASRYDYSSAKTSAASRLVKAAGLTSDRSDPQTVCAVFGDQAALVQFTGRSAEKVAATDSNAEAIQQYLERRNYESCLSYAAFVTLHDTRSLQWDPGRVLAVELLNLKRCADPGYLRMLLDKLQFSAATPDVLAILDQMGSPEVLKFVERKSIVAMGDLYARFGRIDRAQEWYKKADLPPGQVVSRSENFEGIGNGEIRGQVILDGKPLTGSRVGVIPAHGARSIENLRDQEGNTSPFALWWLSATAKTDSSGKFDLSHLTAGQYILMVQLPNGKVVKQISVQSYIPRILDISKVRPSMDLGKVNLVSQSS